MIGRHIRSVASKNTQSKYLRKRQVLRVMGFFINVAPQTLLPLATFETHFTFKVGTHPTDCAIFASQIHLIEACPCRC